jgi:hypothetical protein
MRLDDEVDVAGVLLTPAADKLQPHRESVIHLRELAGISVVEFGSSETG